MIITAWVYIVLVFSGLAVHFYSTTRQLTMMITHEAFSPIIYDTYLRTQGMAVIVITGILYAKISLRLMRQPGPRVGVLSLTNKVSGEARQVTRMTVMIILLMCVTWTPASVVSFVPRFDPLHEQRKFRIMDVVSSATLLFASSSSYLNVVVYGWCNKDFRVALRMLLNIARVDVTNTPSRSRTGNSVSSQVK